MTRLLSALTTGERAEGKICPACVVSIRGEIPHGRKYLVMKDGSWARFIIEPCPLHLLASMAHADKWQRLIQGPCPLWAYQLAWALPRWKATDMLSLLSYAARAASL